MLAFRVITRFGRPRFRVNQEDPCQLPLGFETEHEKGGGNGSLFPSFKVLWSWLMKDLVFMTIFLKPKDLDFLDLVADDFTDPQMRLDQMGMVSNGV